MKRHWKQEWEMQWRWLPLQWRFIGEEDKFSSSLSCESSRNDNVFSHPQGATRKDCILEHNCGAKCDEFHSWSSVVLFEHCERCLMYIFVQNSVHFCTLQVIASTGLLSWICHFFLYFLSIVVAFYITVNFHQAFAFFWAQSNRM